MANNTNSNGGGDETNWGSLIQSGIELVTTGVGAASASKTSCGQQCRAKCKSETGWLFGGRSKCKKQCKADCIAKQNEPAQPPPSKLPVIIMSIIIISAIIGLLWWIFKKKK